MKMTLRLAIATVGAITVVSPSFASTVFPRNSTNATMAPHYNAVTPASPYNSPTAVRSGATKCVVQWVTVLDPGNPYQRNTCTGEVRPIVR